MLWGAQIKTGGKAEWFPTDEEDGIELRNAVLLEGKRAVVNGFSHTLLVLTDKKPTVTCSAHIDDEITLEVSGDDGAEVCIVGQILPSGKGEEDGDEEDEEEAPELIDPSDTGTPPRRRKEEQAPPRSVGSAKLNKLFQQRYEARRRNRRKDLAALPLPPFMEGAGEAEGGPRAFKRDQTAAAAVTVTQGVCYLR
uniref:Nucleoplasmin-like domain-containing protein n=1 Tax=Chromera velia CCMP2878 TaxID=1169474 RepID=A0A0G4GG06_9ALVE|eukprot:Cvel_21725.t1-p1 / transcript=Cvel_21725.t1 / gene=Cvel_21725 / organism=Chromera_velia_CCMP2878 / gene_product=hypothetical protein / transcript_product=hypothetical protein / location=Cvel_scaffold2062:4586-6994(-) / protein_length=194 / sequence_SO=supercontig / SO=protein_coding / is_pseudo=false